MARIAVERRQIMADSNDFTGSWRCVYWYPSNTRDGDDPSEYTMEAYRHGNNLILESMPNEEQSYMLVRLKITDNIATGNWHETTSASGEFKGAQYSGAGQLIVDPETRQMKGKWAGAGINHETNKMEIYAGNWEISPIHED
jgi:hypothetical protein